MSSAHFLCFELHDIDTVHCPLSFVNSTFVFHCFQVIFDSPASPVKLKRDSPIRQAPSAPISRIRSHIDIRCCSMLPRRPIRHMSCRCQPLRACRLPTSGRRAPQAQPSADSLLLVRHHASHRQTNLTINAHITSDLARPTIRYAAACSSEPRSFCSYTRIHAPAKTPRPPSPYAQSRPVPPPRPLAHHQPISPTAACASVRARKFSSLRLASAEGFDLLLRLRSRPAGA